MQAPCAAMRMQVHLDAVDVVFVSLAGLPAAKPAELLVKEARARASSEPVVELHPKAAQTDERTSSAGGPVRAEELPPLPTEAFGAPKDAE